MNKTQLEKLFTGYETAFSNLDIRENAEFFADTFISAGPKGVIAQNKADYIKKAGQASAYYKSVGQTSAKIISKSFVPISDQYTMVTVHWGASFKKTGDELVEFDVSYIVQETGKEPKIILFIAHQDEEEAMKELGLTAHAETEHK